MQNYDNISINPNLKQYKNCLKRYSLLCVQSNDGLILLLLTSLIFHISGQDSLSDEDVLTDKQDCQYPHGDGYALELARHDVTNHIRDDTYEDTVADAVS